MPKTSRTTITNPKSTRMPSQRGTFSPSVPTPDPITPKQIRKSDQLKPSSCVRFTSPKASESR